MTVPTTMAMQPSDDSQIGVCPLDAVLHVLMGPWTTYIIWLLETEGPQRFGVLKAKMGKISSKVLTERLRQLEAAGLVTRAYVASIPPAVTYDLSARGHELRDVLDAINVIALRWQVEDAGPEASAGAAA